MFFVGNTAASRADDLEDVKAARHHHFADLNAGDIEAWVDHHLAGHGEFRAGGGLLIEPPSPEAEKESLGARLQAGFKTNYQLRHVDAKIYGNTAVTTSYVEGTVTEPDGSVRQVHDRLSSVLVKEAGEWKEAHIHRSPLIIGQPETPESRFVGTWTLVSLESRSTEGEVTRPFGEHPLGRLTYEGNGNMSVFAIRPDRPSFVSGDLQGGTAQETQAAFDGLVSYYGTFSVQESQGTMTHHVEGAAFPNRIGTDQIPHFQLEGNRLILQTPTTLRGGAQRSSSVVWERVGD
jgi:hypothetical protein